MYQDGQFDDSRLAINLAQTIVEKRRYCNQLYEGCRSSEKNESNKITGVIAEDQFTKERYEIKAKAVVNATGVSPMTS